MVEPEAQRVCVTGASGFVGTYVVAELLARGYRVRATVRDASDAAKAAHVRALGDVEVVGADLMERGAFDAAVAGCDHVVHTASPVFLQAADPQREIVDVAVDGTVAVLEAARRAGTVRRFVLTSSVATVIDPDLPDSHVFTEDDWNRSVTIADPYGLSKVRAEQRAADYVRELPSDERFELVSILPSFVLGPALARVHCRSSPSLIRDLLRGTFPLAPNLAFGTVDVRDVATAHVAAIEAERPSARYLVSHVSLTVPEMARLLRERYPDHRVPKHRMPDALMYVAALFDARLSFSFLRRNLGRRRTLSSERARAELGLVFRSAEESLYATADSLIENGWV